MWKYVSSSSLPSSSLARWDGWLLLLADRCMQHGHTGNQHQHQHRSSFLLFCYRQSIKPLGQNIKYIGVLFWADYGARKLKTKERRRRRKKKIQTRTTIGIPCTENEQTKTNENEKDTKRRKNFHWRGGRLKMLQKKNIKDRRMPAHADNYLSQLGN